MTITPQNLVAFVIAFFLVLFVHWAAARAWDTPAKDSDPFGPGNPYGQVVEPVDPCGGKQ